jgi:predicted ABC-type transport system involved in lysophospholipase L1 biosynthesis ATPase subunit
MKPIDFVKNDNLAYFRRYRKGILFYSVQKLDSLDLYEFPVPVEDLGDATVESTEKALFLMRYIRKAIDEGTLIKMI